MSRNARRSTGNREYARPNLERGDVRAQGRLIVTGREEKMRSLHVVEAEKGPGHFSERHAP